MATHIPEPGSMSIRSLFSDFHVYRIPSFQRRFVWDQDDIKELTDSIVSGYPIGAIILWRPQIQFPESTLADEPRDSNQDPIYVIDGQQRLTSLILILKNWKITRIGKKGTTQTIQMDPPVSYNPSTKKFEKGRRGIDLSLIVRATMGDFDALKEIENKYPHHRQTAQQIGQRMLDYKIPFYRIETRWENRDDQEKKRILKDMSRIFTRINSSGAKISKLEMFLSFLAGTGMGGEKQGIVALCEQLHTRYGLEMEPILRLIFSEAGLKQDQITKTKAFENAMEKLEKSCPDFQALIEQIERGVTRTFDFLKQKLGIQKAQDIPSENVLLPLFSYFSKASPSDPDDLIGRNIIGWFVIASFNGLYSQSPDGKIDKDLGVVRNANGWPNEIMMNNVESATRTRKITRANIDASWENAYKGRRGVTYRFLLQSLLTLSEADDWAGGRIISDNVSVHHIFPSEFLTGPDDDDGQGVEDEDLVNALANLTLVHKDVNSEIGCNDPKEYFPTYKSCFEKHCIPTDSQLWDINQYEKFLKVRGELLWNAIEKHINSLSPKGNDGDPNHQSGVLTSIQGSTVQRAVDKFRQIEASSGKHFTVIAKKDSVGLYWKETEDRDRRIFSVKGKGEFSVRRNYLDDSGKREVANVIAHMISPLLSFPPGQKKAKIAITDENIGEIEKLIDRVIDKITPMLVVTGGK